jgi:hypothetical protein
MYNISQASEVAIRILAALEGYEEETYEPAFIEMLKGLVKGDPLTNYYRPLAVQYLDGSLWDDIPLRSGLATQ